MRIIYLILHVELTNRQFPSFLTINFVELFWAEAKCKTGSVL